MSFPSDTRDNICNVDGEFNDNERFIEPSKELAEYFIQFRTNDLISALTTFYFSIDINERSIIGDILEESIDSKDEFRNILRDGVVQAILLINFDRTRKSVLAMKQKEIINKIHIDLTVPQNVDIKELSANDHEGEIVTFPAKVSNWGKVRATTQYADYRCPDCGDIKTMEFKPKITARCKSDRELYEFYKPKKTDDTRRIVLREIIDDYSEGKLPASITADIYGKTVWETQLSDKVMVTGIFRSIPLAKTDGKLSKEFIPTIQVISMQNIDIQKIEYPDDALIEKFETLEKEGKLIDAIIDGFAFNVFQKRNEKKAVICSLIGSQWIGKKGNGNPPMIHILFVGDPDTYKSTIMKYIINVSDNCILADSTTVSNAGIKAIAVKMDDGQWSIMAGLLPTYNGGVVFLDEFGDLKTDIYADLKAPMIDGKVSKHVAGEDFNGMAETGILASMNPTEGVYDTTKTIYDNLKILEKPLITRFDIIFCFSKKSKDYDSISIREHFKKCDLLPSGEKLEGLLSDNEIKLFINHVKKIKPELTGEAIQYANDYFSKIEKQKEEGDARGTETRTENAIIKFAVALAKWHMSKKVTTIHVEEALKLYDASLGTFNLHLEDGDDINEHALKTTVDGRLTAIQKAYDSLKDESGYAFEDEVVNKALGYGCFASRGACKTLMGNLMTQGKITFKNNMMKLDLN